MWGLSLKRQLIHSVSSTINSFVKEIGFFDNAVKSAGNKVPLATNMLFLGIISLAALLGSLWLFGNWRGSRRLNWQQIVTHLGSMQMASGAAFVLAAIIAFLSLKLSLLIVTVVLLTTLVITCMAVSDLYRINADRRLSVIGGAMTIYSVIVLVAAGMLLKDAYGALFF